MNYHAIGRPLSLVQMVRQRARVVPVQRRPEESCAAAAAKRGNAFATVTGIGDSKTHD